MVVRPRVRRIAITDAGLRCFVQWARLNKQEDVLDPVVARRALEAYAGLASAIDPGIARAQRIARDEALAAVDEGAE